MYDTESGSGISNELWQHADLFSNMDLPDDFCIEPTSTAGPDLPSQDAATNDDSTRDVAEGSFGDCLFESSPAIDALPNSEESHFLCPKSNECQELPTGSAHEFNGAAHVAFHAEPELPDFNRVSATEVEHPVARKPLTIRMLNLLMMLFQSRYQALVKVGSAGISENNRSNGGHSNGSYHYDHDSACTEGQDPNYDHEDKTPEIDSSSIKLNYHTYMKKLR